LALTMAAYKLTRRRTLAQLRAQQLWFSVYLG
jgi:hypothetical protein